MSTIEPEADPDLVTRDLLARASWTASRSSGPGGQRRDKVATRAELTVAEDALDGLPESVAARLRSGLGLDVEPLRIVVQDERFLSRNQAIAAARLLERVRQALAPPPPPRRPTRPSRRAAAERVEEKVARGAVKRLRRPPPAEE
jgi:ribosome-associated protein